MSQNERNSYIKMICDAIQSYRGFTVSEKKFVKENIHDWIDNTGSLHNLIENFSKMSLDIKPFIQEKKLAYV